jgi:hypothetical protein
MSTHYSKLLRRTFIATGAGLILAGSLPAASQTVTLSGVSGNSCTYSQMTVQPNGTISVTCQSVSSPTPTPTSANFTVTSVSQTAASSPVEVTIARSGGPAQALNVKWTYSGTCGTAVNDNFSLADGGQWIDRFTMGASGSCTVTITPPAGHTASPSTATISIGTSAPPPPTGGTPLPVPVGCPAVDSTNVLARSLSYGPVDQLRMKSNVIAYYPVIAQPDTRYASIEFTQGQQPNTPGDTVTEFSVSRCPGVISTAVPACYYQSTRGLSNNNKITIYTRTKPEWGWVDQASMGSAGCLADANQGQWFVNVRWNYPSCPWGENNCGFSMQWSLGAW